MPVPTLVTLCGALRAGSTNRLLLAQAVQFFGSSNVIEGNLRLPLYDGDIETIGIPTDVQLLADQIAGADAVLVSTPEYNKNLSGVLKNALDWVSRTKTAPWRDKPVAIMSAAAGRSGGERAQNSLRLCLHPFRPRLLIGPEVLIADTRAAFDESGKLKDPRNEKVLAELMQALRAEIARR